MDMPEVLKSLLEHSLPWPEKRTGRNGGGLHWLAAHVPGGGGSHRYSGRTGISKLRRVPGRGLPLAPSWAGGGLGAERDTARSATVTPGLLPRPARFGKLWPACGH